MTLAYGYMSMSTAVSNMDEADNLLFCAVTLFSGQTFAHMQNVAKQNFYEGDFRLFTVVKQLPTKDSCWYCLTAAKCQTHSIFRQTNGYRRTVV